MIITIENRQKKINIDKMRVRNILRKLLAITGCTDKEISIVFVNDSMITELNRLYLGRNHPTNVLSFAISEGAFGDLNPFLLGDVIVSVERALADALSAGLPFEDELDFLMIHGILHLIGYDHENVSAKEKRRMHEKEKDLFYRLKGYPLKR